MLNRCVSVWPFSLGDALGSALSLHSPVNLWVGNTHEMIVGLSTRSDPTWLMESAEGASLSWLWFHKKAAVCGLSAFEGCLVCFKSTEGSKEVISCSFPFPISAQQFNLNRSSSFEARIIPRAKWSWQKLIWQTIDRCPQESGCYFSEWLWTVRGTNSFHVFGIFWLLVTKLRYLLLRHTVAGSQIKAWKVLTPHFCCQASLFV